MKNKIRRLDENLISRISAGEVIERPGSVVKELVENSVDAKATSITIEIINAGKELIRVTDNGIGIDENDLELAFEKHATSKLYSIDDIYCIKTLGFRGEALASILAVSDVEIITKTADKPYGIKGVFNNGKLIHKKEVGSPNGTTIMVKNLFYNTPARYKFLKSDSGETNHIINIVNNLALSHPEISFKFIIDNKNVYVTQGTGDIYNAIYKIYGKDVAKNLIKIEENSGDIKLRGYITNINYSRGNRQLQIFFVNGRYVKSDVISRSIDRAYSSLLQNNKFPACFLYIDIPYEKIDVNVHPAKIQVRFDDEAYIEQFIYESLRKKLTNANLIPKVSIRTSEVPHFKSNEIYNMNKPIIENNEISMDIIIDKQNYVETTFNDDINKNSVFENIEKYFYDSYQIEGVAEEKKEDIFSNLRVIGQLFNSYIVCEYNNSLLLIDQHAAHERVKYEEFMESYKKEKILSQILLEPIVLELIPTDKEKVLENMEFFKSIGYIIENFGYNTIIIREVPISFGIPAAKSFFLEIVENFDILFPNKLNKGEVDKIISKACKKAIKANDKLEEIEINQLIMSLKRLENPFTCPHGRPIFISITLEEIEKKFKRT